MTCRVCDESTHGAWPRWHRGTHCRDCHQSWTGKTAVHTLCCHHTFSSNSAADRHLVSPGKGQPTVCTFPGMLDGFELVVRADGNSYWMPVTTPGSHGFAGAEEAS